MPRRSARRAQIACMFDEAEEAKETDRINSAMPAWHCTELDFIGQSLSSLSRCTIKRCVASKIFPDDATLFCGSHLGRRVFAR